MDINCPFPLLDAGSCRPVMNLQFLLPRVGGIGLWQLDTSSRNSIQNILGSVQMIRAAQGRVSMVPLKLCLGKMEVTPEGKAKKTVNVLQLTMAGQVTLYEAIRQVREPPGRETHNAYPRYDTIPVQPNCRCKEIYRQQAPEEATSGLEHQNGVLRLTGAVLTVTHDQCGRRMPINNVGGMVDAYRRHCDLEFPVSSDGAPPMKRVRKSVERDEDGADHVRGRDGDWIAT